MPNFGWRSGCSCTCELRLSTSSSSVAVTSWSSTRARMFRAENANNALRPKPNSAKETIRRKRSLRLDSIRLDHAVSDAVARVDQRLVERLVDRRAQAVDVHAQRIAVGQLLAPHALLQVLAGDHRGAGLHQRLQELETDRVQLDRLAVAADGERVQVVGEVGDLQHAALRALAAAREDFQPRGQFLQRE